MKRLLSLLLTFCLTASLLPAQVQAAENASSGGLDRLGIRQISEKEYAMTPDVKEYEWILNNGALTQQMMCDGGQSGRRLHSFHCGRLQ